jgi:hypothetical protein
MGYHKINGEIQDHHSTLFKTMVYLFPNSTAIREISEVVDDKVSVTWNSGSSYTYHLADAEQFIMTLNEIVSSKASIGSFINSQIHQNMMQLV